MKTIVASTLVCHSVLCAWCVPDLPFVMVQYAGCDCSDSNDSKYPVTIPHYTLLCVTTHLHSLNLFYTCQSYGPPSAAQSFFARPFWEGGCVHSAHHISSPSLGGCLWFSDNSYNHYLLGRCELLGVGDGWAGPVILEVD